MKADAKTEAEVLAAVKQFFEAYTKRDLAGVIALLAPDPDLVLFGTGADEKRVGLREVLAQVERDWSQSEAAWLEFGWTSISAAGDVAWVATEVVVHWQTKDDAGTIPSRITVVFERRRRKWLIVQYHMSAPLVGQPEGESFPTSIDAVAAALQLEQPDLRGRAAPDGTVTLLFTDIEGSTALNERLGDQRWMDVLRVHNAIVREHVGANGGFEVKTAGDGFMIAFSSARRALQCAIALQRAIADHNRAAGEPMQLRIGLHTGEAIKEADDFYGHHVNLAARIAGEARGGEVLVSSLLKDLTDRAGEFRFDDGRNIELKGVSNAQRVYAVRWQET